MPNILGRISMTLLSVLAAVLLLGVASGAQIDTTVAHEPHSYVVTEAAPTLLVNAFVIFDLETGEVLAAQDAGTPYPIASVTKLFTAAALTDLAGLDATTTITWSDVNAEGRAGKLQYGETYSYRHLRFPLLLESSNDAAAVFERVTDQAVVERMNELAVDAGADTVSFDDASGLSAHNVASAADMALLLRYIDSAYPDTLDITRLSQYIGKYTGWVNNSPVFLLPGYRGGKHGYTNAANRTFAGLFEESFQGESRLVGYVVLGSDNLVADVDRLRTYVQTAVHWR